MIDILFNKGINFHQPQNSKLSSFLSLLKLRLKHYDKNSTHPFTNAFPVQKCSSLGLLHLSIIYHFQTALNATFLELKRCREILKSWLHLFALVISQEIIFLNVFRNGNALSQTQQSCDLLIISSTQGVIFWPNFLRCFKEEWKKSLQIDQKFRCSETMSPKTSQQEYPWLRGNKFSGIIFSPIRCLNASKRATKTRVTRKRFSSLGRMTVRKESFFWR